VMNYLDRAKDGCRDLLVWAMLFCICLGLGYSVLSRYDPRVADPDRKAYYAMTQGDFARATAPYRFRVLTPMLALPVYATLQKFDWKSWDVVFLSLLLVNSLFSATTAMLLVLISDHLGKDRSVGLLAAMFYLCSWDVVNVHLASMVDAGEAFFLTLLMFTLLRNLWSLAPVIVGVGVLQKETVLILGVAGLVCWWLASRDWRKGSRWRGPLAVLATLILGFGLWWLVMLIVGGSGYSNYVLSWEKGVNMFSSFSTILFNRSFLYTFLYLAPLGLLGIGAIPRPMIMASLGMALAAMLAGSYGGGIDSNASRPIFDATAAVLSIASAVFVCQLAGVGRKTIAR
jgi:hypothetical protein